MRQKLKILVYHTEYGCDTGCCGHRIEVQKVDGKYDISHFEFTHPYGDDPKTWALELAQKFIKKHHPECYDKIDWDTLDYSEVSDS